MISRNSQSKINTITSYAPTVYTFSTALYSALTPFLVMSVAHTPTPTLKVLLMFSVFGFTYSVWQWISLILGQK